MAGSMRVELIGVPYDSGRYRERLGAGPEYLVKFGLRDLLEERGYDVRVRMLEAPADSWRAEIRTAFDLAGAVAVAVAEAVTSDAFPLVLSGNCGPAALGCVGGLGPSPAVTWFDAHGDFNTPETTIGGFLDGMALAALTGRCWRQLAAAIPGFEPVPETAVALVGARDLDPLEADALDASEVRRVFARELRERLEGVLSAVGEGRSAGYLHLDLDVLDPSEGRVNPYAAPDGLSRADVEWAIGATSRALPIRAGALTAFDPAGDPTGKARDAALALGLTVVDAATGRDGA